MLTSCDAGARPPGPHAAAPFEQIGTVRSKVLDEISGMQAGIGQDFYVHNDEGKSLVHVIDQSGSYLAAIHIEDAKNRDWEDITLIPGDSEPLLVIGDTGDNKARHKSIRLYFIEQPLPDDQGQYPSEVELAHKVKLTYPDGPRDCESIAYDASSDRILFLSKRDIPPRLYAIDVNEALTSKMAELEFLGEVPTFRAPSAKETLMGGKRAKWGSQPTGMDISADGKQAAVITYLNLYLWSREDDETWVEAFQKPPTEFSGPPGLHDEAVAFGSDQNEVFVTTERLPAPIYRLELDQNQADAVSQ